MELLIIFIASVLLFVVAFYSVTQQSERGWAFLSFVVIGFTMAYAILGG